jgi:hypothetical protein
MLQLNCKIFTDFQRLTFAHCLNSSPRPPSLKPACRLILQNLGNNNSIFSSVIIILIPFHFNPDLFKQFLFNH